MPPLERWEVKTHPALMNFSKAHYFHTFARNMCWVITKGQLKYCKTFLISYNAVTDLINTFLKVSEIMHFLSYAAQYNSCKRSCVSFSLHFIKLLWCSICLVIVNRKSVFSSIWIPDFNSFWFLTPPWDYMWKNTGEKFYVFAVREVYSGFRWRFLWKSDFPWFV